MARDECGSAAVRAGLGTMADMSERQALRRTTMRRIVGVAGAVALAATTWGWPSNAVTLRGPDGGEINGLPAPRENVAVSLVLGAVVCTSDPGWVRVVAVRAHDGSDNFAVEAFSVLPNPSMNGRDWPGDYRGPLTQAGFEAGADRIDLVCDSRPGAGYVVGVQLARTGPGPASAEGFDIVWTSEDGTGTLYVASGVVLCDARTAFPARCDPDLAR